jgi:hypothetical protein
MGSVSTFQCLALNAEFESIVLLDETCCYTLYRMTGVLSLRSIKRPADGPSATLARICVLGANILYLVASCGRTKSPEAKLVLAETPTTLEDNVILFEEAQMETDGDSSDDILGEIHARRFSP